MAPRLEREEAFEGLEEEEEEERYAERMGGDVDGEHHDSNATMEEVEDSDVFDGSESSDDEADEDEDEDEFEDLEGEGAMLLDD